MIDRAETTHEMLQSYHRIATATFNTYMQVYTINPLDARLMVLGRTYNLYATLFNLCVDLVRRKANETGHSDL